jgi:hypothetical protein
MSTENKHNNESSQPIQEAETSKVWKDMLLIWIKWTLATIVSYTLVSLGLAFLANSGGYAYMLAVAVVGGILSGIAQWMILPPLKMTGLWILASAIGSVLGGFAAFGSINIFYQFPESVFALMMGATMGAVVGLGQWLVLRQWVRGASLWVVAVIISWALIWVIIADCAGSIDFWRCIPFWRVYGGYVMMSAITGAVIAFLLTRAIRITRL